MGITIIEGEDREVVVIEDDLTTTITAEPRIVEVIVERGPAEVVEVVVPGQRGPAGPAGAGREEIFVAETPPAPTTHPHLWFEIDADGDVQSLQLWSPT